MPLIFKRTSGVARMPFKKRQRKVSTVWMQAMLDPLTACNQSHTLSIWTRTNSSPTAIRAIVTRVGSTLKWIGIKSRSLISPSLVKGTYKIMLICIDRLMKWAIARSRNYKITLVESLRTKRPKWDVSISNFRTVKCVSNNKNLTSTQIAAPIRLVMVWVAYQLLISIVKVDKTISTGLLRLCKMMRVMPLLNDDPT